MLRIDARTHIFSVKGIKDRIGASIPPMFAFSLARADVRSEWGFASDVETRAREVV